jgi:hypothetical protein
LVNQFNTEQTLLGPREFLAYCWLVSSHE